MGSGHETTVLQACMDRNFCCATQDGIPKLKREHAYFYQIQGQLYITSREWCDFVVYLKDVDTENENTHLERIYKDDSFVTSMVAKLEEFYTQCLAPMNVHFNGPK